MDQDNFVKMTAGAMVNLRTQLSQLSAASECLERQLPEQSNQTAVLNQGICRMLRQVTRMELVRRLVDEDEIRTYPAPVDLSQWLAALGERLAGILAEAGVALHIQAGQGLMANVDLQLLEQMLFELVLNGAKAGNELTITLTSTGDKACITVSDNGPGLPDGELARLFSQQPPDSLCQQQGWGIAIAQKIVWLHDGTLMAQCSRSGGLSVMAALPLRMHVPSHRLASPWAAWDQGGFDPALVAMSELLPTNSFSSDALG